MKPTVLVVANPESERARLGRWLQEVALDVIACPGPRSADPCVGMRGRCPLAEGADVVVLDLVLEDSPLSGSPPGWQVLDVYLELGLGVVVLTDPPDLRMVQSRTGVVAVPRSVDGATLVESVRELAARRPAGGHRRGGS